MDTRSERSIMPNDGSKDFFNDSYSDTRHPFTAYRSIIKIIKYVNYKIKIIS